MIFVSNPSILFKKSQVVQGVFFFFLLSLKLTVLSTVVFLFPKCVFCQWEKLFSEKEGVCVWVGVWVWVRTHAQKRETYRGTYRERERGLHMCVSACMCLCVFTDLLAENPAFTFSRPFRSNCYLCLCVIYLQEIADRFKY